MKELIQTFQPNIIVYRDGQFDRWATYKPVVRKNLVRAFNKVDNYFVTHKW